MKLNMMLILFLLIKAAHKEIINIFKPPSSNPPPKLSLLPFLSTCTAWALVALRSISIITANIAKPFTYLNDFRGFLLSKNVGI